MSSFRPSAAALLISAVPLAPAPSAATLIVDQIPCIAIESGQTVGYCKEFGPDGPMPIIRSLTFDVPGAGTALVHLHGTLYCFTAGLSAVPGRKVGDLTSGIVQWEASIVWTMLP